MVRLGFLWVALVSLAACVEGTEESRYPLVPTAHCGDGSAEANEVCDGVDLRQTACADLGLGSGTLSCQTDCSAFDTSRCGPPLGCGDGNIDPLEVCDGTNVAGESCDSLGFDRGTLKCRTDCLGFDTSSCVTDCVPNCLGRECGLESTCETYCGVCTDGTCSAGQCQTNPPDGPEILSFAANVDTLLPGGTVTFTAVVQAPEGATIAGAVLEDTEGAAYGAFTSAGGGLTISVDWDAINTLRPITTPPGGGLRVFVARFIDSASRSAGVEHSIPDLRQRHRGCVCRRMHRRNHHGELRWLRQRLLGTGPRHGGLRRPDLHLGLRLRHPRLWQCLCFQLRRRHLRQPLHPVPGRCERRAGVLWRPLHPGL